MTRRYLIHCGRVQPWVEACRWEVEGEEAGTVEVLSLMHCEVCRSTRSVLVEVRGETLREKRARASRLVRLSLLGAA